MDWLRRFWNVVTRVVLPVVTAVQRVVQQVRTATAQQPGAPPLEANAAARAAQEAAAARARQQQAQQQRAAQFDRDIGQRTDAAPVPVITEAQRRAMRELLNAPPNRSLHLLVEQDAQVVLDIARRVPGILETVVQLRGSFKAAFDYLLADGVRLAEEEIASLLPQFQALKPRMRGDTDEPTWCLAFPAGSQERRECELAYINAFIDGTRTDLEGNVIDRIYTARLLDEDTWNSEDLDMYYLNLLASRSYCSFDLPQWAPVGAHSESLPFNPPYDPHCEKRVPDDVCVSLPMATLYTLGLTDFNFTPQDRVPRNVKEMVEFLLSRNALRGSDYPLQYRYGTPVSFGAPSPIPSEWEGYRPGSLILYRTDEPKLSPYSHVAVIVGYGPPTEVWLSRINRGESVSISPTFEEAYADAATNGWPAPVAYVIDRGKMGETGGIDNRGPHPYDWNWDSVNREKPSYSVDTYEVMAIKYNAR